MTYKNDPKTLYGGRLNLVENSRNNRRMKAVGYYYYSTMVN